MKNGSLTKVLILAAQVLFLFYNPAFSNDNNEIHFPDGTVIMSEIRVPDGTVLTIGGNVPEGTAVEGPNITCYPSDIIEVPNHTMPMDQKDISIIRGTMPARGWEVGKLPDIDPRLYSMDKPVNIFRNLNMAVQLPDVQDIVGCRIQIILGKEKIEPEDILALAINLDNEPMAGDIQVLASGITLPPVAEQKQ